MTSPKLDEAAIFDAARQIDAADARRRYIEGACAGDSALQARLDVLLLIDQADRGFLEQPAEGVTTPAAGGIAKDRASGSGPTSSCKRSARLRTSRLRRVRPV